MFVNVSTVTADKFFLIIFLSVTSLQEASRMYFADRNPRGMFAILEPLHELIEKGAETMKEQSFMQHFGRDLTEAKECCSRYQQQGNARELSQAWDLYYQASRTSYCFNLFRSFQNYARMAFSPDHRRLVPF